jgi:hypothetical protein
MEESSYDNVEIVCFFRSLRFLRKFERGKMVFGQHDFLRKNNN